MKEWFISLECSKEDRPGDDELNFPPKSGRKVLEVLVEELVSKGYAAAQIFEHSSYGWDVIVRFQKTGPRINWIRSLARLPVSAAKTSRRKPAGCRKRARSVHLLLWEMYRDNFQVV